MKTTFLHQEGGSPLLAASRKGFCDTVSMLCEKGADVNLADNVSTSYVLFWLWNGIFQEGKTALHYASLDDNFQVAAMLLLAYSADKNSQVRKYYFTLALKNYYFYSLSLWDRL